MQKLNEKYDLRFQISTGEADYYFKYTNFILIFIVFSISFKIFFSFKY